VPASTDDASQTRVGEERSHRQAFRVGYAGEYDVDERRDAVSVCLVTGSAGDGILREGLGGWGWGRQRQKRAGGGVKARFPPMGCAPDVSCLASDSGQGHWPRCLRRQELGALQEPGRHFSGEGVVRTSVSVLKQRVVRERTPGPSCPQTRRGSECVVRLVIFKKILPSPPLNQWYLNAYYLSTNTQPHWDT